MSAWRFYIRPSVMNSSPDVFIAKANGDDTTDIVTEFTFVRVEAGAMGPPDPVIFGQDAADFLRAALNAAWEHGLRPDGFHDTRESMKATSAHLEDMRAIAFHHIGAPKP